MTLASGTPSLIWAAIKSALIFAAIVTGGLLVMPVVIEPAIVFDAVGIRSAAPVAVPAGPNTKA